MAIVEGGLSVEKRRWADKITEELRESSALRWQNLRHHLRDEGINHEDAVVLDFGPDGGGLFAGILVVRDGRAFEFTLQLGETYRGEISSSFDDDGCSTGPNWFLRGLRPMLPLLPSVEEYWMRIRFKRKV